MWLDKLILHFIGTFFDRKVIPPLHAAMEELMKVVDNDTNAFSEYMVALKIILIIILIIINMVALKIMLIIIIIRSIF